MPSQSLSRSMHDGEESDFPNAFGYRVHPCQSITTLYHSGLAGCVNQRQRSGPSVCASLSMHE